MALRPISAGSSPDHRSSFLQTSVLRCTSVSSTVLTPSVPFHRKPRSIMDEVTSPGPRPTSCVNMKVPPATSIVEAAPPCPSWDKGRGAQPNAPNVQHWGRGQHYHGQGWPPQPQATRTLTGVEIPPRFRKIGWMPNPATCTHVVLNPHE